MPATFRNRSAGFLWGLAVVWLAILGAMTYVFVRDGAPGYSGLTATLVLAFFWMGGLGLALYVSTKSYISVHVDEHAGVTATWRHPHKVVKKSFSREQVLPAKVIESKDGDGDPYFYATAQTISGEHLEIAEGHDLSTCQQACEAFNATLFGPGAARAIREGA